MVILAVVKAAEEAPEQPKVTPFAAKKGNLKRMKILWSIEARILRLEA